MNPPLTYCMNVHPGESADDLLHTLRTAAREVKAALSPDAPFPLGLRIGARAAGEIIPEALAAELTAGGFTALGINGFPYGPFHGTSVKTAAYTPDWSTPERLAYTRRLFEILAALPFAGTSASVTTVPLAYKATPLSETMLNHLNALGGELEAIFQRTGKKMFLALEPEPDCLLENTDQIIALFKQIRSSHVGLCFDTCHFAVGFEDPLTALLHLEEAGVPIVRIQISAAPALTPATRPADLAPFLDPVYLHQVKTRTPDGALIHHADLTEALCRSLPGSDSRIHLHIPLDWPGDSAFATTASTLTPAFWQHLREKAYPLEAETYTFSILPPSLRPASATEGAIRDILWIRQRFA